jgi:arsenate reductase
MLENPSVIKRPVLDKNGTFSVGFSDAQYQQIFNS